jgi:DNA mismatch endonuclease (patch repair protein)
MAGRKARTTPSYTKLSPASENASKAARASSKKRDTKPELLLRRACWALGLRYRVDVDKLPGRPDLVFKKARLLVFVDGDFWHGRNLEARIAKLERGHNAKYWVAKVSANVARDQRNNLYLQENGWRVLRFWESEVIADAEGVAAKIAAVLSAVK